MQNNSDNKIEISSKNEKIKLFEIQLEKLKNDYTSDYE